MHGGGGGGGVCLVHIYRTHISRINSFTGCQGVMNKMCQLPEFIIVRDHVANPCSS